MYILKEDFVKMASEEFEYGNAYEHLLSIGEEFKEAGLTPIYIYDPEENSVYVTTKEKSENTFH